MTDADRLVERAVSGDLDALRERTKADRHDPEATALPHALAGLLLLWGTRAEFDGYRHPTPPEAGTAGGLFRTARTVVARGTLREHPDEVDEVRRHKWVLDKLGTGPIRRQSRTEQAISGLANLLVQPDFLREYHRRGLFDWAEGDAEAALLVANAWRHAVAAREPPKMTRTDEWETLQAVLADARGTHPENPALEFVDARCRLAWGALLPGDRDALVDALDSLAADDRGRATTLAARATLVDATVRFPTLDRLDADAAVDRLASSLSDVTPAVPRLDVLRAWAAVRDGDTARATTLARTAADADSAVVRADAWQLLHAVDETDAANQVGETLVPKLRKRAVADLRTHLPEVGE